MITLTQRMEFYAQMLKASTFKPSALAVAFTLLYRHLNAKTGRCDPATGTLSRETGLSARTVKSAVEELRNSGWWQIDRGRGRGHTNRYLPDLEKVKHTSPIGPGKGEPPFTISPPKKVKRGVRKGEARLTRTSKNQESDSPTVDLHRSAARVRNARMCEVKDRANNEFEPFWRIYPSRRPHSNPKKPARLEFTAAVKAGADPADIMRGAENYAAYVAANVSEPRYIAQAQTWLSQERWNDYQEAPEPPRLRVGMN